MAGKDTNYKAVNLLFKSKGLIARDAIDRCPEHTYLNLDGCLEREENAISTRFGNVLINRDPAGGGTSNYLLPQAPVTLAYMRALGGAAFRYAVLADGSLWRRSGLTQGAYTQVLPASSLSGGLSTSLVFSLFSSSQPWLLLCDGKQTLKDSGTGTPVRVGLIPPVQPAAAQAYGAQIQVLDIFGEGYGLDSSYTLGGGATLNSNYLTTTAITSTGLQSVTVTGLGDGGVIEFPITEGMWLYVAGLHFETVQVVSVTSSTSTLVTFTAVFSYTHPAVTTAIYPLAAAVASASYVSALGGDHYLHSDPTKSFANAPDGMLGFIPITSGVLAGYVGLAVKYNSNITSETYNMVNVPAATGYNPGAGPGTTPPYQFPFISINVPASSTGTISAATPVTLDLSCYDPNDLIVLVVRVDSPGNISSMSVQFDIANSNYTSSYYTQTLTPVAYQGYLTNPSTTDPTVALADEIYYGTLLATGTSSSSDSFSNLFSEIASTGTSASSTTSGSGALQSTPLSTGPAAWSVIYLQKGNFLPVGNAGQPGLDWSNITAHQVTMTTNTSGSTNVDFNALYIQGGPVGLAVNGAQLSGPSSFAGVGYDYRYIYYNANTGTPSNPSPSQVFSTTVTNPGAESTLIVMRQAIQVQGQYSSDPQVTHVQIYRRGGVMGDDWLYLDQIPNTAGSGTWTYKDVLPDTAVTQSNVLGLANDPPVTSTLQNPVNTTLSATLTPTPDPTTANPNTPTLLTVNVAAGTFVPNQIVNIGSSTNFEQTAVVTGGTNTFTAWVQLTHAIGEQVTAFSMPAVPCTLSALAYNQLWLGGDPNNPHFLYYSKPGYLENFPPQNYIPCGSPSNPIVEIVNFRGTLFVGTLGDTWYQIFPGSPPRAQVTGSKHGPVTSLGNAQTENEVWYGSADGIRTFRGSDGPYMSLPIEWLWRDNPLTPVELLDTTQLSRMLLAFRNSTAIVVYIGQDGNPHRILYDTNYKRWRNDDIPVTAMCLETDTNTLVYSKPMTIPGSGSGWAVVFDTFTQDYDDGGWVAGALVQLPISMTLQTPYMDFGAPNNPKQFNTLTIDANPNGQTLYPVLLFDDNNGTVTPVTPSPSSFTGTVRGKFQFTVNSGFGQQAYRIAMQITAAATAAPIVYQADLYAAELADSRAGYDTYWVKMGADESKIVKQGFFDYTTAAGQSVAVALYADGNTSPYYTFALPPNPSRMNVPIRVRFPMQLLRQFRLVAVSAQPWQLWSSVQMDWKPVMGGGNPSVKGYRRADLGDITP